MCIRDSTHTHTHTLTDTHMPKLAHRPPQTDKLTRIIPGTTLCRVSSKGWVWSESTAALLMSYLKMRNRSARLCRHGRVRFRFWLAYMWFSMLSAGLVFGYLYFKSEKVHHIHNILTKSIFFSCSKTIIIIHSTSTAQCP